MRFALATATVLSALAVPAVAAAYTDNGSVAYTGGAPCSGCTVHIHDNSTGASSTTSADSGGRWSAGGFVSGDSYTISADNTIGSCYYGTAIDRSFSQPANNYVVDLLYVFGTANQSGCPQF